MFTIALVLLLAISAYGAGYIHRAIRPMGMMADIVQFHEKFGLMYDGPPRILQDELYSFRFKFMHEELDEYDREQESISMMANALPSSIRYTNKIDQCLEKQLDALVDLVYVVLGTAYLQFGREIFLEAWKRVHKANMAKVRAERAGDSKRGSTFDVIKPEGWTPPSHIDLIQARHGPVFEVDGI